MAERGVACVETRGGGKGEGGGCWGWGSLSCVTIRATALKRSPRRRLQERAQAGRGAGDALSVAHREEALAGDRALKAAARRRLSHLQLRL